MNNPFPDISSADEDGFLAWSPDLNSELIAIAYKQGVFPWPQSENEVLWFSPPERGILELKNFHQSKSFLKWRRKFESKYTIKKNHDFSSIMQECALQKRIGQSGTWITEKMKKAYQEHFLNSGIFCIGIYEDEELLGGIYAVDSGNYFSAESMFFKRDNLSKLAFMHLVNEAVSRSMDFIDLQMLTPISEAMGGVYISRDEFLKRI